jgi:hypothetical protein
MRLDKMAFNGGRVRKVKHHKRAKDGHSQSNTRRTMWFRDMTCGQVIAAQK